MIRWTTHGYLYLIKKKKPCDKGIRKCLVEQMFAGHILFGVISLGLTNISLVMKCVWLGSQEDT